MAGYDRIWLEIYKKWLKIVATGNDNDDDNDDDDSEGSK